jgi:hypothetical protein
MKRLVNVADYQQLTAVQELKNTGMPILRRAKVAKTGEISIKFFGFAFE